MVEIEKVSSGIRQFEANYFILAPRGNVSIVYPLDKGRHFSHISHEKGIWVRTIRKTKERYNVGKAE